MRMPHASSPHAGVFLAIEGPDGVGKSTLVPRLHTLLENATGREVVRVREPGGTPVAEAIRALLLDPHHDPIDAETSLLLFSAARRDLVTRVIRPAIERGAVVLADRFALSTYVYQGDQGASDRDIDTVTRVALGDCWPDATIVLTLSPEVLRHRIAGRHGASDQFERRTVARLAARVARYEALATTLPGGVVLPANGTPDEVAARALELVLPLLRTRQLLAPHANQRSVARSAR